VIPDETKALELHKKYGSNERIIQHCFAVAEVADAIAEELRKKGFTLRYEEIKVAALLHDIGRTKLQSVHHGYVGAELLKSLGVDERVCEIVRKHVGAGITPEEARSLGFPEGDYMPQSIEEKIVCLADKMVDSDTVRPFEEEVRRFERKGHDVRRLLDLKRNIESLLGQDLQEIIFVKLKARTKVRTS
jgi:uncharacterized protein